MAYTATLTVAAGKVSSDLSSFPVRVDLSHLSNGWWTDTSSDLGNVRVKQGGTWSAVTDKKGNLLALPLTIGNPPLTCGQGSNQANFGTLRIANTLVNSTNDQIAMNIAAGLQHSLAIWVGATSPWQCRDGAPPIARALPPLVPAAAHWPEHGAAPRRRRGEARRSRPAC